ncbi:phosphocholine-specific phospholipase C [Tenggerimyces flavus]|uniref:phospholipase C n=1 Tax=Tenggerimyces flavus TaxID=1708749 RepID=A0ABV7YNF6_9ACTN|nr:phospholipase C, phosphocholine-specific [Tenggerimyces flavus]MBM7786327.1 phospholipase C [Tenggerimyces flavus]
MGTVDRRSFLAMMGAPAVAAAVPDLSRALAIPASDKHRSIKDVEHVIFLMQENRSFDHYFGTLRGVRGFADPHPVRLGTGKSVWHQPDGANELLPFRPEVPDLGQTFLPDPPHGWTDGHNGWNGGRHDQWVPNKGVTAMTYHTRDDIPYQYALADAFTICDNYFCSLLGPTDPNRYHMWSGWVGNDGKGGGPVVDNAELGYGWSTYPERLERNGVSWRVYQDSGIGLNAAGSWGWTNDPYIGNYGDNSLLYFNSYRSAEPGNPLADKAKVGTSIVNLDRDPEKLLTDFREDVKRGRLPKVSWVVAPEAYTEHPNWTPDFGAWYVSQVIDILASNPDVWGKMALFITFDEDGGFFDHLVPPTPPQTPAYGKSTAPTTNEIFPGSANYAAGPYGLGIRVPMIIVSPWTRGGWVNSQLFDHTSMIKFLEARFMGKNKDLFETNITPWRRAVVGDLTSAFDFREPNRSRFPRLPDTDDLKPTELERQPDEPPVPPADPELPRQERGVRPARALPYVLYADAKVSGDSVDLSFRSTGDAAGVFQVRSADPASQPRSYTVEPDKSLADTFAIGDRYDLTVHGPNGFFRQFKGSGSERLEVRATCDSRGTAVTLKVTNKGTRRVEVVVADQYSRRSAKLTLSPGESESERRSLAHTKGWYHLVVTIRGESGFQYGYAGHVENGKDSISDPRMGRLV